MDPTGEHPMTELSDSDELELELLSLAFDANMARQPMPDGSDPMTTSSSIPTCHGNDSAT
jgi:hypothetical protein